jgi:hypothetical protein
MERNFTNSSSTFRGQRGQRGYRGSRGRGSRGRGTRGQSYFGENGQDFNNQTHHQGKRTNSNSSSNSTPYERKSKKREDREGDVSMNTLNAPQTPPNPTDLSMGMGTDDSSGNGQVLIKNWQGGSLEDALGFLVRKCQHRSPLNIIQVRNPFF